MMIVIVILIKIIHYYVEEELYPLWLHRVCLGDVPQGPVGCPPEIGKNIKLK